MSRSHKLASSLIRVKCGSTCCSVMLSRAESGNPPNKWSIKSWNTLKHAMQAELRFFDGHTMVNKVGVLNL